MVSEPWSRHADTHVAWRDRPQDPSGPVAGGGSAGRQCDAGVRAVKRLQYRYSQYLDAGLWDDLADLFAIDAAGQFREGERVNWFSILATPREITCRMQMF